MADEEHFSLCWNNFSANLSTGFHESLLRGDLVDVTLVADGQMVKAHRLVLSVCSPLFRDMFATMPANQHAFVMLKDMSYATLKDLIQFIYCGEVNVRNDSLNNFITVAESFKIKGMTDSMEAEQPQQPQVIAVTSPPPPVVRQVKARVFRSSTTPKVAKVPEKSRVVVESEDSSTEEKTPVMAAPKRGAATKAKVQSAAKRVKAESVSKSDASAVLDISTIENTTAEEHEITESDVQEDPLIEEVPYEDIKYDETYFTEPEDNKSGTDSKFVDTATSDLNTTSENQGGVAKSVVKASSKPMTSYGSGIPFCFRTTPWKTSCLVVNNFIYNCHSIKANGTKYWRCHNYSKRVKSERCRARCVSKSVNKTFWIDSLSPEPHNHPPHNDKIKKYRSPQGSSAED